MAGSVAASTQVRVGPGISWPEAYHVTYLLGYHSHVVTASQDSADMYGYTEQAIGHFPAEGKDLIDKVGGIIQAYWRGQSEYQDPWEMFWQGGMIDSNQAEAWALEAWERRTAFNGDMPGWYEDRLESVGATGQPEDQRRLSRFKRLIDAGTPFEELPDDLRRWWINRY